MEKKHFDAIVQAAVEQGKRNLDNAAGDIDSFLQEIVALVEQETNVSLTADDKKKLKKAITDALRREKDQFFRDAIDRAFS